MRKAMVLLLGTLLVSGVLVGCPDQEAVKRQQATAAYEAAMGEYDDVASGFVASGDAKAQDLVVHLETQLSPVQKSLEGVKNTHAASLSKTQMSGLLQALSDIHAARGRLLARQARMNSIQIDERTLVLHGALSALEEAGARVRQNTRDDAELRQTLQADKQSKAADLQRFTTAQSDLQSKIDDVNSRIENLTDERNQLLAKEQQLRQDGFVKEGDEQYELYVQADKTHREALKKLNEIQGVQKTELEPLMSQKREVDRQVEVAQQSVGQLDEALASLGAAGSTASSNRDQAMTDRDARSKDVAEAFDALNAVYYDSVAAKLGEAGDEMVTSINLLSDAVQKSSPTLKSKLQSELFKRYTEATNIRTQQVAVIGEFGKTVAIAQKNAERVGASEAADFQTKYGEVQKKHSEVLKSTNDLIDEAVQSWGDLSESETANETLVKQKKILDSRQKSHADPGAALPESTGDAVNREAPVAVVDLTPDAGDGGTVTAISGSMPALPDMAFDDRVFGIVVVDGSKASPDALNTMLTSLLGPAAQGEEMKMMIDMVVAGYSEQYGAFSAAGGTGLVLAFGAPENEGGEPAPFMFISKKSGTDSQGLKDLIGGMAGEELEFVESGEWLIAHETGGVAPAAGSKNRTMLEEALATQSGKAIAFAIVNDPALQNLAEQSPTGETPEELEALLEDAEWIAGSISLDTDALINASIKMPGETEAQEAATMMNEQFQAALEESGGDPAMGMIAGLVKAAANNILQIKSSGDKVNIRLNLKPVAPMVAPMLMQMMMPPDLGEGGFGEFEEGEFEEGEFEFEIEEDPSK